MRKLVTKGRYLSWEDGTPFFYLGDTAWELFHKSSREEARQLLQVRAEQGFTVIQAVALGEFEGLTVPNFYGAFPLAKTDGEYDPTKPVLDGDYSYWDHVDFIVEEARALGLFIAMLPTWGDKFNRCWGTGPEIFHEENAFRYGAWIGGRYQDAENIIWMLGGDRPLEEKHRKIIDAMGLGIRSADQNHLITFHPPGAKDSTDFVKDAGYIDFHAAQTGHGTECYNSGSVMEKMAAACPDKPYLDAEPRYEDHPACFNEKIGYYWNADDVRQNLYWSLLSGACGHTYGNHNIWGMNRSVSGYFPFKWQEALRHPGANQVGFGKKLRLRRDYFSLVPAKDLLAENFEGMGYMAAAKGKGYAYIYAPLGIPFTVNLDAFPGENALKALWFDPRTGEETLFSVFPAAGKMTVAPPSCGKGCDWVLVLEEIEQ